MAQKGTPPLVYRVPTAVMVDGDYFLRRYGRCYGPKHPPERIAKNLFTMCIEHLDDKNELYRIFFYDCRPLAKKAHHPLTGKAVDFSKTSTFAFRSGLHKELVRQRKVALRLGRLGHGDWKILPGPTKELLEKRKTIDELAPDDIRYDVAQKGVDMRIGLDIASLSQKQLVRRIVLVAGDADFVPAAKFARREGIDVILDPMWRDISDDLLEHIDGLRSVCPRPNAPAGSNKQPSFAKPSGLS